MYANIYFLQLFKNQNLTIFFSLFKFCSSLLILFEFNLSFLSDSFKTQNNELKSGKNLQKLKQLKINHACEPLFLTII